MFASGIYICVIFAPQEPIHFVGGVTFLKEPKEKTFYSKKMLKVGDLHTVIIMYPFLKNLKASTLSKINKFTD